MSEAQEWQPAPATDGVTAGMLLRRAREASGLHVAALAVSLKVPVRKLEALEDDRYQDMPDVVFIRGLASSVCRALKIDPQPVLERLPQSTAPRLVRVSDGLNEPFRAPSDGEPPSWVDQLTQPVFLAVFALLLGALVLILLPAAQKEEKSTQVVQPVTPSLQDKPTATAPVFVAPAPSQVPADGVPAQPPPRTGASVPIAAAAVVPVTAASVAPAPANGTLVFRAKAESWVEVIDAKGAVPVRKILVAGEVAAASGAMPLQVTIGRVDAIDVQVRGRPFDLRPVSRDNVARFEVK